MPTREIAEDRSTAQTQQSTSGRLSHWWVAGMALSVGSIYLYRLAAEPFPILLFRGCYRAAPVILFWMVAFSAFCRASLLSL